MDEQREELVALVIVQNEVEIRCWRLNLWLLISVCSAPAHAYFSRRNGCSANSRAVFLSSGTQASMDFTKDKKFSLSFSSREGSVSARFLFGIRSLCKNSPISLLARPINWLHPGYASTITIKERTRKELITAFVDGTVRRCDRMRPLVVEHPAISCNQVLGWGTEEGYHFCEMRFCLVLALLIMHLTE